MNSNEDTCDNDKYLQTKQFEFIRIRSLNFKSDNRGLSESQSIYKVPKKRSGHRAVCNEENLWVILVLEQRSLKSFNNRILIS